MADIWKTVRVFISSTFRDMHAERDYLVKVVFPSLRERLEKYRMHLVDIDLRWGITEEEAQHDRVLDMCLQQIDECRPFFVGILGERYGWVPSTFAEEVGNKYGWVQHHTGKSVTELEIVYGVLRDPAMHGHGLFFFRDPAFIADLPTAKQADFRVEDEESAQKLAALKQAIRAAQLPYPPFENYPCHYGGLRINGRLAIHELNEADRETLRGRAVDGLIAPDEYRRLPEPLRRWADRDGVVHLTGLAEFSRRVFEQLWRAIRQEHSLPETPPTATLAQRDPLAEEADYHEQFIESRLRVYVGREEVQKQLCEFAEGAATCPGLMVGPPGAGKSAAMARFVQSYRNSHPGILVIPHFVGASPGSTSLRQMLARLCLALKNACGFADEVPQELNKLAALFRDFLHRIPADRRTVLALDALDQLDAIDNAAGLYWLPQSLPPHVKVMASCLDAGDTAAPILKAFAEGNCQFVPVRALTANEQRQIIRAVPSLSAKTLDDVQVDLLLSNPATSNPLFLLVALEELRGFGSFEQLDHRIVSFPHPIEAEPRWREWLSEAKLAAGAIAEEANRRAWLARLTQIESSLNGVAPVDDTLTAIFLQVIDRLESDFDPQVSAAVLALLASARRGLLERELLDLMESPHVKTTESQSDLFPVLRQLKPYLLSRAGLLGFYHGNLSKAVTARYLNLPEKRLAAHARLAEYFYGQDLWHEPLAALPAANVRKVDELPWQLIQADHFGAEHTPAVESILCDLGFVAARCACPGEAVDELLADFDLAVAAAPAGGVAQQLDEWRRQLRTEAPGLRRHPHLAVQQLAGRLGFSRVCPVTLGEALAAWPERQRWFLEARLPVAAGLGPPLASQTVGLARVARGVLIWMASGRWIIVDDKGRIVHEGRGPGRPILHLVAAGRTVALARGNVLYASADWPEGETHLLRFPWPIHRLVLGADGCQLAVLAPGLEGACFDIDKRGLHERERFALPELATCGVLAAEGRLLVGTGSGRVMERASGTWHTIGEHCGMVRALALSGDGRVLVSGGSDGALQFRRENGQLIQQLDVGARVNAIDFDTSCGEIIAATEDGRALGVSVADEGSFVSRGQFPAAVVRVCAAGGGTILIGDTEQRVYQLEPLAREDVAATPSRSFGPAKLIATTPGSDAVAVVAASGECQLLNLGAEAAATEVITVSAGSVVAGACNGEGEVVIGRRGDRGIKVTRRRLDGSNESVIWPTGDRGDQSGWGLCAFSPDGAMAAGWTLLPGGALRIEVRETRGGRCLARQTVGNALVTMLAVAPEGRLLLVQARDQDPVLWRPGEIFSAATRLPLEGARFAVFGPSAEDLLLIDWTGKAWLSDRSSDPRSYLELSDQAVVGSFSADGRWLVIGERSGRVRLLERNSGRAPTTIAEGLVPWTPTCCRVEPEHGRLLVGGPRAVQVWQLHAPRGEAST